MKLSMLIKINKKYIKSNWRESFIREKYNNNLFSYICFHALRYADIEGVEHDVLYPAIKNELQDYLN